MSAKAKATVDAGGRGGLLLLLVQLLLLFFFLTLCIRASFILPWSPFPCLTIGV